eukprot:gene3352-6636_t
MDDEELKYFTVAKKAYAEGDFRRAIVLIKHVNIVHKDVADLYSDGAYALWRERSESAKVSNMALIKECFTALLAVNDPSLISIREYLRLSLVYIWEGSLVGALHIMHLASKRGYQTNALVLIQIWPLLQRIEEDQEDLDYFDRDADNYIKYLSKIITIEPRYVRVEEYHKHYHKREHCLFFIQNSELCLTYAYVVCAAYSLRISNTALDKEIREISLNKYNLLMMEAFQLHFDIEPQTMVEVNLWYNSYHLWYQMGLDLEDTPFILIAENCFWEAFTRNSKADDPLKHIVSILRNTKRPELVRPILEEAFYISPLNAYARSTLLEIGDNIIWQEKFIREHNYISKIQAKFRYRYYLKRMYNANKMNILLKLKYRKMDKKLKDATYATKEMCIQKQWPLAAQLFAQWKTLYRDRQVQRAYILFKEKIPRIWGRYRSRKYCLSRARGIYERQQVKFWLGAGSSVSIINGPSAWSIDMKMLVERKKWLKWSQIHTQQQQKQQQSVLNSNNYKESNNNNNNNNNSDDVVLYHPWEKRLPNEVTLVDIHTAIKFQSIWRRKRAFKTTAKLAQYRKKLLNAEKSVELLNARILSQYAILRWRTSFILFSTKSDTSIWLRSKKDQQSIHSVQHPAISTSMTTKDTSTTPHRYSEGKGSSPRSAVRSPDLRPEVQDKGDGYGYGRRSGRKGNDDVGAGAGDGDGGGNSKHLLSSSSSSSVGVVGALRDRVGAVSGSSVSVSSMSTMPVERGSVLDFQSLEFHRRNALLKKGGVFIWDITSYAKKQQQQQEIEVVDDNDDDGVGGGGEHVVVVSSNLRNNNNNSNSNSNRNEVTGARARGNGNGSRQQQQQQQQQSALLLSSSLGKKYTQSRITKNVIVNNSNGNGNSVVNSSTSTLFRAKLVQECSLTVTEIRYLIQQADTIFCSQMTSTETDDDHQSTASALSSQEETHSHCNDSISDGSGSGNGVGSVISVSPALTAIQIISERFSGNKVVFCGGSMNETAMSALCHYMTLRGESVCMSVSKSGSMNVNRNMNVNGSYFSPMKYNSSSCHNTNTNKNKKSSSNDSRLMLHFSSCKLSLEAIRTFKIDLNDGIAAGIGVGVGMGGTGVADTATTVGPSEFAVDEASAGGLGLALMVALLQGNKSVETLLISITSSDKTNQTSFAMALKCLSTNYILKELRIFGVGLLPVVLTTLKESVARGWKSLNILEFSVSSLHLSLSDEVVDAAQWRTTSALKQAVNKDKDKDRDRDEAALVNVPRSSTGLSVTLMSLKFPTSDRRDVAFFPRTS